MGLVAHRLAELHPKSPGSELGRARVQVLELS
jgi:hypothetical protein